MICYRKPGKKRMKTSVSSGDVRECHGQRFGSQLTSGVLRTQARMGKGNSAVERTSSF